MNEVIMLYGTKPHKVLMTVVEKRIPVTMSYSCEQRWRQVRVMVTHLSEDSFVVKVCRARKSEPVRIEMGQRVGMSLQCGYGGGYDRFIFGATAVSGSVVSSSRGGAKIRFAVPEEIDVVQRRSFLRVRVPEDLDIGVNLCHRTFTSGKERVRLEISGDWRGRVVDISAGGLLVAMDFAKGDDFKVGESVGVRFRPMVDETELVFNTCIKSIQPTASGESICLGLETVGLEASAEGRLVLRRLCNVVDQYDQLNQSSDEWAGEGENWDLGSPGGL